MTPTLPDDVWLTSAKTAARAAYLCRPPAGAHTAALDPPHNARGETRCAAAPGSSAWPPDTDPRRETPCAAPSGSSGYGHALNVLDLIYRAELRLGVPDHERVDAVEGGGRA